jgi:hypothetical protein
VKKHTVASRETSAHRLPSFRWIRWKERLHPEVTLEQEIADGKLTFQRAIIRSSNSDSLLTPGGRSGSIDLLSLDIDSNDYHVWRLLL